MAHALVPATNHIFVLRAAFTLPERDLLFSLVSCSSSLASASRLPSSSSQMLSASQLENKLFFLFLFSLMKYGVRGEDFQFLDHMIFLFKLEKKEALISLIYCHVLLVKNPIFNHGDNNK